MSKDAIEFKGTVMEARGNANFLVKIESGSDVLCTISGSIRKHSIRILEGDYVSIEVSPYDLTRGRIIYRYKGKK